MKRRTKVKPKKTREGWAAFCKGKRISRFFLEKKHLDNLISFLVSR